LARLLKARRRRYGHSLVERSVDPCRRCLLGSLHRFVERIAGGKTAGKIGYDDSECLGLRAFLDEDGIARHMPACFRIFATLAQVLLGMRNHDYSRPRRMN